jgi:hypothetical protein
MSSISTDTIVIMWENGFVFIHVVGCDYLYIYL